MSTLSILQLDEDSDLDDDQLYQSRQAIKNVCAAIRSCVYTVFFVVLFYFVSIVFVFSFLVLRKVSSLF